MVAAADVHGLPLHQRRGRAGRGCAGDGRHAVLRHSADGFVPLLERDAQPPAGEHRPQCEVELHGYSHRLPAARRAHGLDGRYCRVCADGGVQFRHEPLLGQVASGRAGGAAADGRSAEHGACAGLRLPRDDAENGGCVVGGCVRPRAVGAVYGAGRCGRAAPDVSDNEEVRQRLPLLVRLRLRQAPLSLGNARHAGFRRLGCAGRAANEPMAGAHQVDRHGVAVQHKRAAGENRGYSGRDAGREALPGIVRKDGGCVLLAAHGRQRQAAGGVPDRLRPAHLPEYVPHAADSGESRREPRRAGEAQRLVRRHGLPRHTVHPLRAVRQRAGGCRIPYAAEHEMPLMALRSQGGRDDDLGTLGRLGRERRLPDWRRRHGQDDFLQPLRIRRGRRLPVPPHRGH